MLVTLPVRSKNQNVIPKRSISEANVALLLQFLFGEIAGLSEVVDDLI